MGCGYGMVSPNPINPMPTPSGKYAKAASPVLCPPAVDLVERYAISKQT